jgi:acyl-CoA thioesterase
MFAPICTSAQGHRSTVPSPLFWNGRGPFGGWVAAIALQVMAEAAGPDAVPRSLSVAFHSRLAMASFELHTSFMSQGQSVVGLRTELRQDGKICVTASAMFGRSRPDLCWETTTALPFPRPADVEPYEKLWPLAAFTRQFDYRIVSGLPFSGALSPHTAGWLRLRSTAQACPPSILGPAELLLLADAWFPPLWTMVEGPVPVSTLSLDVVFHRPEVPVEALADGFIAASHETRRISDGYADEQGLLSLPDGRPVLQSQQLTWVGVRVSPEGRIAS